MTTLIYVRDKEEKELLVNKKVEQLVRAEDRYILFVPESVTVPPDVSVSYAHVELSKFNPLMLKDRILASECTALYFRILVENLYGGENCLQAARYISYVVRLSTISLLIERGSENPTLLEVYQRTRQMLDKEFDRYLNCLDYTWERYHELLVPPSSTEFPSEVESMVYLDNLRKDKLLSDLWQLYIMYNLYSKVYREDRVKYNFLLSIFSRSTVYRDNLWLVQDILSNMRKEGLNDIFFFTKTLQTHIISCYSLFDTVLYTALTELDKLWVEHLGKERIKKIGSDGLW